jgi:hypothetical protein
MSLAGVLAEDRRLVVLRSLAEDAGYSANEMVLQRLLDHVGHRVARDMVRADLAFLAEHGLIRLETLAMPPRDPRAFGATGELWVAHLLPAGEDVAKGRMHPGVARLPPS